MMKDISNNYSQQYVVFPLRVTKDGVMVWCDDYEVGDNYIDGHLFFWHPYIVGRVVPVPIRVKGATLAEAANRAVQLCEERGIRPLTYHPMLNSDIEVNPEMKKYSLYHHGVAIMKVRDDGENEQNSYGRWQLLSEMYDHIELCNNDEKKQILVYIRQKYTWRVRRRMFGWRHLLRRRWPL